jgi:hypothetical protein
MATFCKLVLVFLALTLANAALADTRVVVADVATLQASTTSPGAFITITCYYSTTPTCAGGGDFDRNLCGTDTDNGATIIQDNQTTKKCYYRKNFGLNGVVDARQCGVIGDGKPQGTGHPDDAARLDTCLKLAAGQLGSSYAIPVVNTGGGVILDNTMNVDVPENVELTCGGNDFSDVPDDDYRSLRDNGNLNLSNGIVIDPSHTVSLDNQNSSLTGCNVEAGAGASNTNPFSPSVWYANCKPGTSPCDDSGGAPFLRSAIEEQSAFGPGGPAASSTGITVTADHVIVRNVTVLGFGTCYSLPDQGATRSRPVIEHLSGDCNTGISIINSNNPHANSFKIAPLLTSGSYANYIGDIETISTSGGLYQVTAEVDTFYTSETPHVGLVAGDTVWIALGKSSGPQSAKGRWTIGTPSTVTCSRGSHYCQRFTLTNSVTSGVMLSGDVNSAIVNGVPPTAIRNILPTGANFNLVSPGQTITDTSSCVPGGATVAAVWPARGIVYMSVPALCSSAGDSFTFGDSSTFTPGNQCTAADGGTLDQQNGCLYIDSAFRYGDGVTIGNTGGASVVNCSTFEHMVAFHMTTGANNGRWVNCATGNNVSLPDRNLAALANGTSNQNLISLLIDGAHSSSTTDACDISWSNSVLGQHRPVAIVVQSSCTDPDKFTNVTMGVDNAQQNGIGLELDGGAVALTNGSGGGGANIFKADQTQLGTGSPSLAAALNMSSNYFPNMTLIIEDTPAGADTVGCGNVFAVPTPYLCAPSSFTQAPGGRLTLTSCASGKCYPVMTGDVTAATHVYYVPYTGQQIPIYSGASGTFGLTDIGAGGLTLDLDSTGHLANTLYDIFAEIHAGTVELCTGPAWTNTTTRSIDVVQAGGIWVNIAQINCRHSSSATRTCAAFECTYLGTMSTTATAGQTAQQFGPNSGSGGSGNCLCLYNAYNHVVLTSESLDSENAYDYNSNTWRAMGVVTPNKNNITVVDGLGQMQVSAQLHDAVNKKTSSGSPGAIGINFNTTSGAPTQFAQTATTTLGTYGAILTRPPVKGLWYVQAMESATTNGVNATFGGSSLQEISIHVED